MQLHAVTSGCSTSCSKCGPCAPAAAPALQQAARRTHRLHSSSRQWQQQQQQQQPRLRAQAAAQEVLQQGDAAEAGPALPDVQPDTKEVEKFLTTLVNDTAIAEMHLQVGTFELKVKRSTGGLPAPAAPAPAPPPTVVIAAAPAADKMSLDAAAESMDESLVYVPSPKVGIFTRGKYVGGKRVGKGNVANKGDKLKKGQTLGYVEQLGTYMPVEAPHAGEVMDFLVSEGAAVEYGEVIVELAPFFGGHIIGDAKLS